MCSLCEAFSHSCHMFRSVFILIVCTRNVLLRCVVSRFRLFIAGLWFHLDDCPLLTEEEESDGDMNIVGLGRSSGLGPTDEEPNLLGLHRSSQFGRFSEQNFNNHEITPCHAEGKQGGLPVDLPS